MGHQDYRRMGKSNVLNAKARFIGEGKDQMLINFEKFSSQIKQG